MKKLSLVVYGVLALLIFWGCKKSTSSPSSKVSTWELSGISYTANHVIFVSLNSINSTLTTGEVAFGNMAPVEFYLTKATVAGTYSVASFSSLDYDSTQCVVEVSNARAPYGSTGKIGDSVYLAISGGKRTVTFNNITVIDEMNLSDTTTVSGTLIEQ